MLKTIYYTQKNASDLVGLFGIPLKLIPEFASTLCVLFKTFYTRLLREFIYKITVLV